MALDKHETRGLTKLVVGHLSKFTVGMTTDHLIRSNLPAPQSKLHRFSYWCGAMFTGQMVGGAAKNHTDVLIDELFEAYENTKATAAKAEKTKGK